MINRQIPDFCAVLQADKEPWFYFTQHFKQKNCPFAAGYVETFKDCKIKKIPDYIPFTMVGKYRATFFSYYKDDKGKTVTDCMRVGFEFLEA